MQSATGTYSPERREELGKEVLPEDESKPPEHSGSMVMVKKVVLVLTGRKKDTQSSRVFIPYQVLTVLLTWVIFAVAGNRVWTQLGCQSYPGLRV